MCVLESGKYAKKIFEVYYVVKNSRSILKNRLCLSEFSRVKISTNSANILLGETSSLEVSQIFEFVRIKCLVKYVDPYVHPQLTKLESLAVPF